MQINFGCLNLNKRTEELITKVVKEGKVGQSEYIEEFEEKLAKFLGVKHCILVNNGTMADTIALAVVKNIFPGKKKVLVPALTFIAQVNSIIYNHLEPVFYDNNKEPKEDKDTLCVFPVHLLGRPNKIVKKKFSVPIIEDACEAFGSKLDGQYCGTIGDMGTFSFFPSHTISTGEGGAIVTNNFVYAEMARKLRNHGRRNNKDFKFDVIGFNGKLTTLQAVIGLSLLDEMPELFRKRNENFIYLGGEEGPGEFIVPHGLPRFYLNRDAKREELFEKGIVNRNYFSSIPTQEKAYKHLGYKLGDFPKSEVIGDYGLYVPCHQNLTRKELDYIKQCL